MSVTPPIHYPRAGGSPVQDLPIGDQGPADFYPPVCLKTHWDPTTILRRTLPSGAALALPLDPRPWTRVCMQYTTAGEQERAPDVPASVVLPSGGQFYPPGRYQAAIDEESQLRRLDRPLGTCEGNQWEPSLRSDMFNAHVLVPDRAPPADPTRVHEISFPRALLRTGPYDCREANDRAAVAMTSDFIFNNATKQDRYKTMGKAARPALPAATLQAARPAELRPDLDFSGRPEFVAGSYGKQAAIQRATLQTEAVGVKAQQVYQRELGIQTPPVGVLPTGASARA